MSKPAPQRLLAPAAETAPAESASADPASDHFGFVASDYDPAEDR